MAARKPLKAISSKPKKCAVRTCRAPFVPSQTFQTWCSPECGLVIARAKQDKERKALAQVERREIKAAKERIKSRGDYLKDAQQAFNAWVRERDAGLPCISCGTTADVQFCAGHYKPSGSNPALRFEPMNVHRQCNRNCNMAKSGNLTPYRIELIKRIGLDNVEWLEGPHEPKKYTIDALTAITAMYRAKLRELRASA